jgi:alpha-glucosidase
MSDAPWWKRAVFYQIYPRSFADTTGTGIGDLAGVTSKLDHLAWLGVDAIWLSPFYASPMADYGYDVSDYCDVDPLFGTLEDFDALVRAAHARGLRVVVDFVPCHSSSAHPWFQKALADPASEERSFYCFRDVGTDGGPPNNWTAQIRRGIPAWTRDDASGQYYLHSFLPEQPDLDWGSPEVRRRMLDAMRFWMERGVDGFRLDALHNLGKDPALPSLPAHVAHVPHESLNDDPRTHDHLREMRRAVDAYDGDRVLVGEVWIRRFEKLAAYYGDGDELHLSFWFPLLGAPWDAGAFAARVASMESSLGTRFFPAITLSNHDVSRHRTRFGGIEARARAAAVLSLTLRGAPFLYQGEELGLADAEVPPERMRDPGGRDPARAPIPWDESALHGWPAEPWLPFPPEARLRNVASQRADERSILHLYRRLIETRKRVGALSHGAFQLFTTSPPLLAYRRSFDGETRLVAICFGKGAVPFHEGEGLIVEVSSDGEGEGEPFDGWLDGDRAVILRPR